VDTREPRAESGWRFREAISGCKKRTPDASKFSKKGATTLLAHDFDKDAILRKRLPYERLDLLTIDLLLGIR
jgi:hypothetical protein